MAMPQREKISGKSKDVPAAESRKRRLNYPTNVEDTVSSSCGTSSEVSAKKLKISEKRKDVPVKERRKRRLNYLINVQDPKSSLRGKSSEDSAKKKETQSKTKLAPTCLSFTDTTKKKLTALNGDKRKKREHLKSLGTDKEKTETVTDLVNVLGLDDKNFDVSLDADTKAASQNRITHMKDQKCNEMYKGWKQDANAWRMCIEKNDKKEAQRLICERILPDHEMLNKASTAFRSYSEILKNLCDEISSCIKAESNEILDVYAVCENTNDRLVEENAIEFVVITMSKVAIENNFGYKIEQKCTHDVNSSLENKEIALKEREYPQNDEEIIKAERVMNRYSQALMKRHKNITRISVSWVKSTKFGTADAAMRNEVCVSIYVPRKGLIPIEEKPFPKQIDGFSVDVREGVCVPFLGSHDVHKNIKIACAISGKEESGQRFTGTLGGFLENNKKIYGLTCAHVFLQNPNLLGLERNGTWETTDLHDPLNFVYQPSQITKPFGSLAKAVFTTGDPSTCTVDAAVFHVQNRHPISGVFPDAENDRVAGYGETNPMLYTSGKLSEIVNRNELVVKHGIATGITKGRFRARSGSFRMSFTQTWSSELFNLYEIVSCDDTKFATFGDSGAMVFTIKDNELIGIGIVEAGMGDVCFVTPIYDVFRALGLQPPFEMKKFVMDDDTRSVCSGGSVVSNPQKETKPVENAINDKTDNLNRVMSQDIAKQMEKFSTKIDQQLLQFKTEIHRQKEQLCTHLEKKMMEIHKESLHQIQTMMNQLFKTVDGK